MSSSRPPQVVVITGASAGVGRATARAFGARGARVALIARGRDGLEATRREIESLGGEALVALAALRRMSPRNRGAIVQVGSALAYRGIPLQSAYCAAKHALQGFCDSRLSARLSSEIPTAAP